jgi:hypothetical protein
MVTCLPAALPLAAVFYSLAHSAQQLYTVAIDDAVAQAAAAVTTVAANGADTSSQDGGTFGFLADGFEAFLKVRVWTAAVGLAGCSLQLQVEGTVRQPESAMVVGHRLQLPGKVVLVTACLKILCLQVLSFSKGEDP